MVACADSIGRLRRAANLMVPDMGPARCAARRGSTYAKKKVA
jgi:hypothetical protein